MGEPSPVLSHSPDTSMALAIAETLRSLAPMSFPASRARIQFLMVSVLFSAFKLKARGDMRRPAAFSAAIHSSIRLRTSTIFMRQIYRTVRHAGER